jgi:RNA polymerase sigma factor (sigma-70 family)
MADGTLTEFLHRLRWSLRERGEAETTDTELLRRFLENREEAAFAALVERHGPMVLGVCRHLVPNGADADDAFQATFLVLVRRAASIRKPQLLGNWLYGVAHRVAARARVQAARRRDRERPEIEMIAADPSREASEWNPVLHEELKHLPEKYRAPVVLCYIQGKTNQEAAQLLAWPVGTVKGRLTRARELLRKRLTRRGVSLSVGALTAALQPSASSAAVPAVLMDSTVRAAMLVAAGPVAVAGVSTPVAALTKGVLQTMFLTRLATVSSIVVGVSLLGTTAALVAHRTLAAGPEPAALARSEPPAPSFVPLPPDEQKQEAAEPNEDEARRQSLEDLKKLALAMWQYFDEYGHFPPAAVYSMDGKPLLSWRVLLLPYLDQRDLYTQFKLDEPWDGPNNKKLLAKMPAIYSFASGKGKENSKTVYQVFTGAGTVFPTPKTTKKTDITDGTSNTLLIVEAADAVEWTKPADLAFDPKKPLPTLGGGIKKGCFQAALADGDSRSFKQDMKQATLRALITINGGEVIDPNDL